MCEVVEIRVLNIGDADAIILVLQKNVQHLIVLIDAGRPHNYKRIRDELGPILIKYKKDGPDLVVCTHYDYDHIGGIEKVVSQYALHIQEIWMHKTSTVIEIVRHLEMEEEGGILSLPKDLEGELQLESTGIVDYEDEDIQNILQKLKHEVETLNYLKSIGKVPKEPIAGECFFPNWPEVQVIGPTTDYYQKLFPEHFNIKSFLEAEALDLRTALTGELQAGKPALDLLDELERSALTSTNLNSAIILIETDKGKFLFPGDAGIASFYEIPNYETVLKDLYFLKVPHHGSANNLNSELIKLMSPKIAFISGNHHVSPIIVEALKERGTTVQITSSEKRTLIYPDESLSGK